MEQGMGMMRDNFGERPEMQEGQTPQMNFSPQEAKFPEAGFTPLDAGSIPEGRGNTAEKGTWLTLGICGSVLLLGLLLTRLFRRK